MDVENIYGSDNMGMNDEMESGYASYVCDSNLVRQIDNISKFSCYSEEFNSSL